MREERERGEDTIENAEELGGVGVEKERGRTSVSASRSFCERADMVEDEKAEDKKAAFISREVQERHTLEGSKKGERSK